MTGSRNTISNSYFGGRVVIAGTGSSMSFSHCDFDPSPTSATPDEPAIDVKGSELEVLYASRTTARTFVRARAAKLGRITLNRAELPRESGVQRFAFAPSVAALHGDPALYLEAGLIPAYDGSHDQVVSM